jgi:hypothetical protein
MDKKREPVQLELPFNKREVRKYWLTLPKDIVLEFSDVMQARWFNSRVSWDQYALDCRAVLRGSRLFKIDNSQEIYSKMRVRL